MLLNGKRVSQITPDDIMNLLKNSVCESKLLEYKSSLPGGNDAEKREFLADISAFANADGGVIVYGISEKRDSENRATGEPDEICGIQESNLDKEIIRMSGIVRSGLDPVAPETEIIGLEVESKNVVIVGIPKSLLSPHMVVFKNLSRFYLRHMSGKVQMDVHELRRAFNQMDLWEKSADNFRRTRIQKLLYESPMEAIDSEYGLFIHILPLGNREALPDVVGFGKKLEQLCWNRHESYQISYNIDGPRATLRILRIKSFIQGFRDGGIEIFVSLPREESTVDRKEVWTINGYKVEEYFVKFLLRYIDLIACPDIGPPIIVYTALTGVKGLYMFANLEWIKRMDSITKMFDRETILMPGIPLHDLSKSCALDGLLPSLDVLWQAAGWEESPFKETWMKLKD